jgi:hypothetical protein
MKGILRAVVLIIIVLLLTSSTYALTLEESKALSAGDTVYAELKIGDRVYLSSEGTIKSYNVVNGMAVISMKNLQGQPIEAGLGYYYITKIINDVVDTTSLDVAALKATIEALTKENNNLRTQISTILAENDIYKNLIRKLRADLISIIGTTEPYK